MSDIDLLIVGPAGRDTGGVARYIAEHSRILPERVQSRTYDVATPEEFDLFRSLLVALGDAVRFPFQRRPDVVHVHTSHYNSFYLSAFYVFIAAFLWRRPVITHVHGSSFDEFVRTDFTPIAWLQSAVFGASDRVIVLSEYWREALSHRAADEKLVVLPNAVDPAEYDPQFDVDRPHVAFVSNHIERKGIRELTDAVAALHDDGIDCEVTIAGTGPLSDCAARLAAESVHVTYTGFISETKKRALLDRASIYVLPTHAEGLPIALLEAMAGGNALVSTHVGSIPEVVGTENGKLVEPGDATALSKALQELIEDPEMVRSMSRTNRTLVEEKYSWDRSAEQLTDLYMTLCQQDADRPAVSGGQTDQVGDASTERTVG